MNKQSLELLFTKLTKAAGMNKIDFGTFFKAMKTIAPGDEPEDLEAFLSLIENKLWFY